MASTVGFISPPGWRDPSPAEFPTVCADAVVTQQYPLPLLDFSYDLDAIARTDDDLRLGCRVLAAVGCDAIGVVGTPFGCAGFGSIDSAGRLHDDLVGAGGVPVVSSSSAVISALRALGAERVGLACTYYTDAWRDRWARFVTEHGFSVVARSMTDQDLTVAHDVGDRDHWSPSAEQIVASVALLVEQTPDVDAVAVSGAGARTLAPHAALQDAADRPVIGVDVALYWMLAGVTRLQTTRALASLPHWHTAG